MDIAEMLEVLEDEFARALDGTQGPAKKSKGDREKRTKELDDTFKARNMRRPAIPPSDKRPASVKRGALPKVVGHITRPKNEGNAEQAIEVPATVQLWHVEIPQAAFDVDRDQFRETYAKPAAESLAEQGLDLGLNAFAPLEAKDRAAMERVTGQIRNVRKRALVVCAKGWKA